MVQNRIDTTTYTTTTPMRRTTKNKDNDEIREREGKKADNNLQHTNEVTKWKNVKMPRTWKRIPISSFGEIKSIEEHHKSYNITSYHVVPLDKALHGTVAMQRINCMTLAVVGIPAGPFLRLLNLYHGCNPAYLKLTLFVALRFSSIVINSHQ